LDEIQQDRAHVRGHTHYSAGPFLRNKKRTAEAMRQKTQSFLIAATQHTVGKKGIRLCRFGSDHFLSK